MMASFLSLRTLSLFFLTAVAAHASASNSLSLDGEWRFALDPGDHGISAGPDGWKFPDTIQLPGILTAQGFGDLPSFETKWTGETWRYPEMFVEWQKPDNFGLLADKDHAALAAFPADIHSNWQYWEIVTHSRPFILTPHHDLTPIIQPIDDWFTNRKLGLVFEAKVGNGRLLACSADLTSDLATRPAARQLRHSLESYLAGPAFSPSQSLQPNDLRALTTKPPRIVEMGASVSASSEEKGFEAANAIDGRPKTLWHSRYSGTPDKPPYEFTISFPKTIGLSAILITQRQDGKRNGNLTEVEVLDENGKLLTSIKAASYADKLRIVLPENTRTSKVTLRLPTVANGTHAAIAKIDIDTPDSNLAP